MLGYDCWLSAAEALRVPHRKGLGKNRRFGTSDSRLGRYHTIHSTHNVGALTEKSFYQFPFAAAWLRSFHQAMGERRRCTKVLQADPPKHGGTGFTRKPS